MTILLIASLATAAPCIAIWLGDAQHRSAPELLAAYDEQVRRRPVPDGPDDVVEHDGGVVRCVSATGWSGVTYSDLAGRDADAAIAAQLARMAGTWEWKHYSYDAPPDLPERLLAAGFEAEEPETLMVAELDRLDLPAPAPPGIEVRAVGADGIADLVAVHDAVFGGDHVDLGASCAIASSAAPPSPSSPTTAPRRSPPTGSSSARAPTSRGCGATPTLPHAPQAAALFVARWARAARRSSRRSRDDFH